MRIRKNANFSQLSAISTSSLSSNSLTKTHLNCLLNQSPWDIITFPTPNSSDLSHCHQLEENFGFAGNESFGDSIRATQSPGPPVKTCLESEEVLNNDMNNDFCIGDSDLQVGLGKKDNIIFKDEGGEDIVLCCEMNMKGWQCGRTVTKNGQTHKVCARHLKSCKKSDGSDRKSDGTQKRGRGRPPTKKKEPAPAPAENNYDEYHHYSKLGSPWGKNKESGRKNGENLTSMSKNEDKSSKFLISDIYFMECDEDDDDEDDGGREIGTKRGRKRIKARSLKSLM